MRMKDCPAGLAFATFLQFGIEFRVVPFHCPPSVERRRGDRKSIRTSGGSLKVPLT